MTVTNRVGFCRRVVGLANPELDGVLAVGGVGLLRRRAAKRSVAYPETRTWVASWHTGLAV